MARTHSRILFVNESPAQAVAGGDFRDKAYQGTRYEATSHTDAPGRARSRKGTCR